MRSFLRANWLEIALVIAGIGMVSGWTRASHYEGVADAEAAAKVRAMQRAEANADSATAARTRAHAANQRAEAQREAHDSTVARLTRRLRDLGASHDSLQAAAEAELQAHDGWLSRETHERVVDNLERTLLYTDSLRMEAEDLARTERERGDALQVQVGALMAQVGTLQTVIATQDREIIALRAAADAGSIFPDFGDLTKPVYVLAGAAVGYGLGKLTR